MFLLGVLTEFVTFKVEFYCGVYELLPNELQLEFFPTYPTAIVHYMSLTSLQQIGMSKGLSSFSLAFSTWLQILLCLF